LLISRLQLLPAYLASLSRTILFPYTTLFRSRVDFLRRQVMTSRNIRGGALMTWAMGGLNYQIEHHLFPRMPSANLRRARVIDLRSEEHTSELQSRFDLVCRLLLEKKKEYLIL